MNCILYSLLMPKKEYCDNIDIIINEDQIKLQLTNIKNDLKSDVPQKERIIDVPGVKKWQCKKCLEMFETSRQLRSHKRGHKPRVETHTYKFDDQQELYVCDTCSAEFQEEEEAKKHCEAHIPQFECADCNLKFKTAYRLGCHRSVHNDSGLPSCPLCTFSVSKRSTLFKHINYSHLKKFLYVCETCGKGFDDAVFYKEHANEHTGLRPFICLVCEKSFIYSRYLYNHQVRTHRVGIEGQMLPNQCPHCNSCLGTAATLEKHIKNVHTRDPFTKEKKHLCDTCGKAFRQKTKLIVHKRIHTGLKPYSCKNCDKKFSKKYQLVIHERVHSGKKPYACEYCGKCFSQVSPLRTHVRTHTGEKPYTCQYCGKGFSQRYSLRTHVRTHTGEKPYACQFCSAGFIYKRTLNTHYKNCSG